MKKILVESCRDCMFSNSEVLSYEWPVCRGVDFKQRKGLHDYPKIPDWCPLEDEESKKCE